MYFFLPTALVAQQMSYTSSMCVYSLLEVPSYNSESSDIYDYRHANMTAGTPPQFCRLPYLPNRPSYDLLTPSFLFRIPWKFMLTMTLTAFKHASQEVIDFYASQASNPIPGVPKFDSRRVVDGQRLMVFLKPLPATSVGKKFELRSKVLGVYDKGKAGSVVETEQSLVEKG